MTSSDLYIIIAATFTGGTVFGILAAVVVKSVQRHFAARESRRVVADYGRMVRIRKAELHAITGGKPESKFAKPCPFFPDRPCYPPLCADGCADVRAEPSSACKRGSPTNMDALANAELVRMGPDGPRAA